SPSLATFRSIARTASRSDSTSTAEAAPRESASRPIAPEPAKRSRTAAPSTGPIRLNAASRTRSEVGRVSVPFGGKMRAPFREPATIRMGRRLGVERGGEGAVRIVAEEDEANELDVRLGTSHSLDRDLRGFLDRVAEDAGRDRG